MIDGSSHGCGHFLFVCSGHAPFVGVSCERRGRNEADAFAGGDVGFADGEVCCGSGRGEDGHGDFVFFRFSVFVSHHDFDGLLAGVAEGHFGANHGDVRQTSVRHSPLDGFGSAFGNGGEFHGNADIDVFRGCHHLRSEE